MAARVNSPGVDADAETPERTDGALGYDSDLDDEYDDALAGEARTVPATPEQEHESAVRPGAGIDAESDADAADADAEAVEAGEGSLHGEGDDEDGNEYAADRTAAGPGEHHPDMVAEPDPYQLISPIPGQPNSGPVLAMPGAGSDAEADAALEPESEPERDLQPGLERETPYDRDNEPQIVGAAADDLSGEDTGLDEAEGREQFDEAAASEDVADYDDSAAGYELAEEEGVNPSAEASPSASVSSVTSASPASASVAAPATSGLLSPETQEELLGRWTAIQVSFVDGPADSVRAADTLIRDIGTAIQTAVHERTDQLAGSWQDTADTEQLRLSLQDYRAFLSVVLPR